MQTAEMDANGIRGEIAIEFRRADGGRGAGAVQARGQDGGAPPSRVLRRGAWLPDRHYHMCDRYGLTMSRQQQLLLAWDRENPVSTWERVWDSRPAKVLGHHNPLITGERAWTLGR